MDLAPGVEEETAKQEKMGGGPPGSSPAQGDRASLGNRRGNECEFLRAV